MNKPHLAAPPPTPVDVFAPWAGEEERALRMRIHRARDLAQARATRSEHEQARSAYWLAAELAGEWVFKRASNEALWDVLKGLTWLFLFAGMIIRLDAPDA